MRHRFSIISDEVSQEITKVVSFLREFELSAFELRSMAGRSFKDLTNEDVVLVKRVCEDEGLAVVGCDSPVFKCDLESKDARDLHVDIFKRSVEIAAILECEMIRVFTFLRRDPMSAVDDIRRATEYVHELSTHISGTRIKIGIENEASTVVGTGPELARCLSLLKGYRFGAVWDPCNALSLHPSRAPTTGFEDILPRTLMIHVKDSDLGKDGKPFSVPVGEGRVDWGGHVEEIDESGYDGYLSLETHYRAKRLDEKMKHLPGGYEFSHGGVEASRLCMQNLIELTEEARR